MPCLPSSPPCRPWLASAPTQPGGRFATLPQPPSPPLGRRVSATMGQGRLRWPAASRYPGWGVVKSVLGIPRASSECCWTAARGWASGRCAPTLSTSTAPLGLIMQAGGFGVAFFAHPVTGGLVVATCPRSVRSTRRQSSRATKPPSPRAAIRSGCFSPRLLPRRGACTHAPCGSTPGGSG